MMNINNVIATINELEDIKAKEEKTLSIKGDICVDVRDFLSSLKDFEISGNIEEYGIECKSGENFLGNISVIYGLEEIKRDNTYNYLAAVNYDIDFTIYECNVLNKIYVSLRVHKDGDIRGGYTDSIILEFKDDKDLNDNFYCNDAVYKTIDINVKNKEFSVNVNMWNNEKEIFNNDGYFVTSTCNYEYDYIINDIVEALEEQ